MNIYSFFKGCSCHIIAGINIFFNAHSLKFSPILHAFYHLGYIYIYKLDEDFLLLQFEEASLKK